MLMYFVLTMVEGNLTESSTNIINNHQNHLDEPSIADQVEIIFPNTQQSLPIKRKPRLNKDPKFIFDQVEVFSTKKQTFVAKSSDGKPEKFVSSRPLFVYRNEARKKEQQNYGYGFGYTNVHNSYPYPYPFSYYTNHGVYHYYPNGRY